jgi:predicted DNA-binding transcriptional regulator AlpA
MNDTRSDDSILTMGEAAEILKMTERQVYELTRRRSQERQEVPFPCFSLHSKALRVRRSDLMAWIERLAKRGRTSGVQSPTRGSGE